MAVPVNITGHIYDLSGNLATSGTVVFTLTPTSLSTPYRIDGVGDISNLSVEVPLINASPNLSTTLWGNDVITPSGSTYRVEFKPGGIRSQVWNGLHVFGAAYNLDSPIFGISHTDPSTVVIPNATIPNSLLPAADNAYDLGSPTQKWAVLNAETANIASANVGTVHYNDLDVSGTINGDFVPSTNNLQDLGSPGAKWNASLHNVTWDAAVGPLTGNVIGDLTGDVTGNVTGNVTGLLIDVGETCYDVSTFAGAEYGAKINAAYAAVTVGGHRLYIPKGVYDITTPVAITTNAKPAILCGAGNGATILNYTPTGGSAITYNCGEYIAELPSPGLQGYGIRDLSLITSTSVNSQGLVVGGTLGARGSVYQNLLISGFSKCLVLGDNIQEVHFYNINICQGVRLIDFSGASNSGEAINFIGCTIHNATTLANAVYSNGLGNAFPQQLTFIGCQFDYGAQIYAKNSVIRIIGGHWENDTDNYFLIADANTMVAITDVIVSHIAAAHTKAMVQTLSGAYVTITNMVGHLGLAEPYIIADTSTGSRVSIIGGSTLNISGYWAHPYPYTGTGIVSVLPTATMLDMAVGLPGELATTATNGTGEAMKTNVEGYLPIILKDGSRVKLIYVKD